MTDLQNTPKIHTTDTKQKRDGEGRGQWTKMDERVRERLEEMASTPLTVAGRPRHPTHTQGTGRYGRLLQYEGQCLKDSGEDSDQPAATAKHVTFVPVQCLCWRH